MRKIREVLRLAFGVGLALRKIERSMGISHATVSSYVIWHLRFYLAKSKP